MSNIYKKRDYTWDPSTSNYVGTKRSWGFYDKNGNKLKSHDKGDELPKNNGKWDNGFLTGRNISGEWDGKIKSIKVPIGSWATVSDSSENCETNLQTGTGLLNVYWGIDKKDYGSQTESVSNNTEGSPTNPQQVDPDVARYCSDTKKLTNTDDYRSSTKDIHGRNIDCSMTGIQKGDGGGKCVKSGVHYPSYCQLGENLNTDYNSGKWGCKSLCEGVDPKDSTHYCNLAKSRLCNLGKNDKCVGDNNCTNWWTGEKICSGYEGTYCGTFTDPNLDNCLTGWGKYCSNPDNFKTHTKDCRNLWKKISKKGKFDPSWATSACKGNLSKTDYSKSIFGGICDELCIKSPNETDNEINPEWCKEQQSAFCKEGDNMFSIGCQGFCTNHPDDPTCTGILRDGFCTGMKSEDMNKDITEIKPSKLLKKDKLKVGNFCGCYMSKAYYADDRRKKIEEWVKKGITKGGADALLQLNTSPKCFYEWCKTSSPMPNDIKIERECPDCVQIIIQNIKDSKDSTFINDQIAKCTEGKSPIPPVSPDDPPVSPDDPPDSPDDPPVSPNIPDDEKKRMIILIAAGMILFLVLIGLFRLFSG